MPSRKKNLIPDAAENGEIKKTRKISRSSASSSAPPPRMRILGAEEKRQLILAHAAMRQPVDATQRFSLWMGVTVCLAVIAVGWLYMMRQGIVEAYQNNQSEQSVEEDPGDLADGQKNKEEEDLFNNLHSVMDQIEMIEEENYQELRMQAEAKEAIKAAMATGTESATTTGAAIDRELFRAAPQAPTVLLENFPIPDGVSVDN